MEQNHNRRVASNAGLYYPASRNELMKLFALFNFSLDNAEDVQSRLDLIPNAIIAPHGEFYLSGFSANIAHRVLAKRTVKRVVVIGPTQLKDFRGISGGFFDRYQTPFGDLKIDRSYLNVISANFDITFEERLHQTEHSTETQMPFLAHYQPNTEVIELIYKDCDQATLKNLIKWLLEDSLTSVVICSNLSNSNSEELVNNLDTIAISAIANRDSTLLQECEADGLHGIEALIDSAHTLNLQPHILDYRTTADTIKDHAEITGFTSAAFTKTV